MTFQELLNSQMDLQALGETARRGFDWWTGELAGLFPDRLRSRFSSRPRIFAERQADGRWRVSRGGRQITGGVSQSEARREIAVLLDPNTVLVRELKVPRMSPADVRRMLELDVDRFSPLNRDLVHFDFAVVGRGDSGRLQNVLVGIVTRSAAAATLDAARAAGLEPRRLCVRLDGTGPDPLFDFLPAAQKLTGARAGSDRRAWWWWAVTALFAANVALLVGRDYAEVARLQKRVEAQAPAAEAASRLRAEIGAEQAKRRDLVARSENANPLKVLNAVTEALPDSAWVQHLEWNGRNLRLVGFSASAFDAGAAIRGSGMFANPRLASLESQQEGAAGKPFDLTADARARP